MTLLKAVRKAQDNLNHKYFYTLHKSKGEIRVFEEDFADEIAEILPGTVKAEGNRFVITRIKKSKAKNTLENI